MIIRKYFTFIFLLVVFTCFNQTVFGCQCGGIPDITIEQILDYNLKSAELVFSGKVEKIEYQSLTKAEIEAIKSKIRQPLLPIIIPALEKDGDFKRVFYSFKPSLFWKGHPKDKILIFSTEIKTLISEVIVGYSSCAYPFEVGESYIVFARKEGKFFEVNRCGATHKSNYSQRALDLLGKGRKFKPWYVFW